MKNLILGALLFCVGLNGGYCYEGSTLKISGHFSISDSDSFPAYLKISRSTDRVKGRKYYSCVTGRVGVNLELPISRKLTSNEYGDVEITDVVFIHGFSYGEFDGINPPAMGGELTEIILSSKEKTETVKLDAFSVLKFEGRNHNFDTGYSWHFNLYSQEGALLFMERVKNGKPVRMDINISDNLNRSVKLTSTFKISEDDLHIIEELIHMGLPENGHC